MADADEQVTEKPFPGFDITKPSIGSNDSFQPS